MKHGSILGLLLLVGICGCNGDDDDDGTTTPVDPRPSPTLSNIWPHADGTGWVYELAWNRYELSGVPGEAQPLPLMSELHAALGDPITGTLVSSDTGLYRLRFEGEVTTHSGVTAQNLVGTFYDEVSTRPRWSGDSREAERRFLAALARSRRDLAPAIATRLGVDPASLKSLADAYPPFFLGNYTFAAEADGFWGYGDVSDEHSWHYLPGDLSVGTEFSLQLVPDLADDIWLHGRIWSIDADRDLECMYVVDLGIETITNEEGDVIGTIRPYWYGRTIFRPTVGPIACIERHLGFDSEPLQDDWMGIEEYTCELAN